MQAPLARYCRKEVLRKSSSWYIIYAQISTTLSFHFLGFSFCEVQICLSMLIRTRTKVFNFLGKHNLESWTAWKLCILFKVYTISFFREISECLNWTKALKHVSNKIKPRLTSGRLFSTIQYDLHPCVLLIAQSCNCGNVYIENGYIFRRHIVFVLLFQKNADC